MSSDLSIFAARLRDFIGIAASKPLYLEPSADPVLKAHFDIESTAWRSCCSVFNTNTTPSTGNSAERDDSKKR